MHVYLDKVKCTSNMELWTEGSSRSSKIRQQLEVEIRTLHPPFGMLVPSMKVIKTKHGLWRLLHTSIIISNA